MHRGIEAGDAQHGVAFDFFLNFLIFLSFFLSSFFLLVEVFLLHRWPCPPGRARAAPPAVFVFASGVGVGGGVGGNERGMGTPVDYNLMVLFFFSKPGKNLGPSRQ